MLLKSDETNADRKIIKCFFCEKIHYFPDDGEEFPVDKLISLLLNMRISGEHGAAKESFDDVSQLLEKLLKLDREGYAIDYFEKVEAQIQVEKELKQRELTAYYQKLVAEVQQRKITCLNNLRTNHRLNSELEAIKRQLSEYENKLKRENVDFVLKTLSGGEAKWREIKTECTAILEKSNNLREQLTSSIIGDQLVEFISRQSADDNTISPLENIYGHLKNISKSSPIDSSILVSSQMQQDLLALCKREERKFLLIYRATRDGFSAANFHAKCDNRAKTLTIIKTTRGFVFGGYTDAAWDSLSKYKADPNAFIFSLVNPSNKPLLIPVKAGGTNAIYCHSIYGPTFSCDIAIADNSNANKTSYSRLGCSYDFKLHAFGSTEA
jgi:hypothetical protein